MNWFSKSKAATPRTYIGRWMEARILGDSPRAEALQSKLNGGQKGWNDEEPGVVEAACELCLHAEFPTGVSQEVIDARVREIRDRTSHQATAEKDLPSELVARVMQRAMAWPVQIEDIPAGQLFSIRFVVLAQSVRKRGLGPDALVQLIIDAEDTAFTRGFQPPLAQH